MGDTMPSAWQPSLSAPTNYAILVCVYVLYVRTDNSGIGCMHSQQLLICFQLQVLCYVHELMRDATHPIKIFLTYSLPRIALHSVLVNLYLSSERERERVMGDG